MRQFIVAGSAFAAVSALSAAGGIVTVDVADAPLVVPGG